VYLGLGEGVLGLEMELAGVDLGLGFGGGPATSPELGRMEGLEGG
jgi:hypothetical protein